MPVLPILAWPLLGACALGLALWIVVAVRVGAVVRTRPTVRAGLDLPADDTEPPLVSIVVPAHDEERVIDACARSLRNQRYPALEIVFVLDRCTDGTLAIARRHADADPRVRIIENDACPDGWAGKCNAAWLGARAARGAWLLFTDADTTFDPDLVRASVDLARHRGLGLLSLLSTLTTTRLYERVAQPVASMNLVRLYPISRVNRAEDARPFANGQFLLFDRAWYDRIGGHAAVKDDLLEDIAFARLLKNRGGRGGLFLADGMLVCSMYDSLAAFKTGWKRIFIEACKRKPGRLRGNGLRVLGFGLGLPLAQLAALLVAATTRTADPPLAGALAAVALAGLLVQAFALSGVYALGGTPRRAIVFYPAGCWVVGRLMLDAASDLVHRRPIAWGGREYVLEPR